MNKVNHGTIFKAMEQWAPKHLAYEWDNVGLQIGSATDETTKVMVTLDVIESVIDEAIENKVNLLIAHHPFLFKAINSINIHSIKGKVIKKALEHNITIYAAHTNLDIADNGVNDLLCDALHIKSTENLIDIHTEKILKLAVFVPRTHVNEVREALGNAGAGHIGNYSHCTFQTEGQGTFMPGDGTNPFIGTANKTEHVDEIKIETVVKEKELSNILLAMQAAHPYEEIAYDLFPLKYIGKTYGLGKIGILEEALSLQSFAEKVKQTFKLSHAKVVGDLNRKVKKVAVIGGSGEKYINQAKKMGADVFITGDVTFHHAQDALEMGLSIIDPGHYIEEIMIRATTRYLTKHFANLPIIEAQTNTNPFQFV